MNSLKGLRVHVEGMGLTGALLAHHLALWGCRAWSWHDIDAPITAWKASTGAIFPAGKANSLDEQCYRVWERWAGPAALMDAFDTTARLGERPYPMKHFETAAYWFSTKSAPHEGDYRYDGPSKHGLRHAWPFSFHLNAQTFVPATRKLFNAQHRSAPPPRFDAYVIAHGFSQRLDHVLWGWHVPVKLRYADYCSQAGHRPCFYFREGRFLMAYAYPIPGTEWWYAGSSLIHQTKPAQLEVQPKYDRWKREFERLGGGAVKVIDRGGEVQGWRPAEGDAHVDPRVKRLAGKRLAVPPLWHSGIRHFPRVLQQLKVELTKIGEE